MTEQPLDLVRRAFAAVNRLDVEAVVELCHPDVEWRPMRQSRAGTVYRGRDGVRQAIGELIEDLEELRNDPREVLATGDAVVVTGRLVAKERATGVRLDRPAGWLCVVRDGLIREMTAFPNGEAALAAALERSGTAQGRE